MIKNKPILGRCNNPECDNEFDYAHLKRVYGESSSCYIHGYCSAWCYTQHKLKQHEKRTTKTRLFG